MHFTLSSNELFIVLILVTCLFFYVFSLSSVEKLSNILYCYAT